MKLPAVDKAAHFSTAYVACDLLYKIIESGHLSHMILVVAIINVIGLVKEIIGSRFDKNDILANIAGSGLWLLTAQVNF